MRTLPLCIALLLLAACGGSGGGDDVAGSASELVSGSYRYFELRGEGGDTMSVTTANVQSDGAGSLVAAGQRTYSEGAVIGPVDGALFDYGVEPDRTIVMHKDEARGRVTADGMLATATSRVPAASLSVLMKMNTAPTLADLEGEWLVFTIGRHWSAMFEHRSSIQLNTINGAGSGAADNLVYLNEDSHASMPMLLIALDTYTIEPSGEITISLGGSVYSRGAISADGELMMFAGGEVSGNAYLSVMVRLHPDGVANGLSGAYSISGWESRLGSPFVNWGTWNTDTLPVQEQRESQLSSQSYELNLATLEPNGIFELVRDVPLGTDFWTRGVTARSAEYAVVGGGLTDMNNPILTFLIR